MKKLRSSSRRVPQTAQSEQSSGNKATKQLGLAKSSSPRGLRLFDPAPSKYWYSSLRLLGIVLLRPLFGVRRKIDPRLKELSGSVLFLGNHQSYLDPLFAAVAFPYRRFNFVTGEFLFQVPVLATFLRKMRCIPKRQFSADPSSVLAMLRSLKEGGAVLLYPEGQRSFDGGALPQHSGCERLAKKAGAAVVLVCLRGSYFSWPRWSLNLFRPGAVTVEFKLLRTAAEVQDVDSTTLQQEIAAGLALDDYSMQRERPRVARYLSARLAKGLDRLLHRCPHCGQAQRIVVQKNRLCCSNCSVAFVLQSDYSLKPCLDAELVPKLAANNSASQDTPYSAAPSESSPCPEDSPVYSSIMAWHHWQVEQEALAYKAAVEQGQEWLRFPARLRLDQRQADGSISKQSGQGEVYFDGSGCHFTGEVAGVKQDLHFPHRPKKLANISFHEYFQLNVEACDYSFFPEDTQVIVRVADLYLALF